MDAKTFLQNEYGNADNFNSRQLLDSLNAIEQHLLIELMDKFATELANGAESKDGKLLMPHVSVSLPFKDDVELAKWMHDTYEEVSLEVWLETQPKCKTTFDKLPTENKITMIEVAGRLLTKLRQMNAN